MLEFITVCDNYSCIETNYILSTAETGLQRLDAIGASPRALDVVQLLDAHAVLLPGGRDPEGHPLLTFPSIGHLREKLGREDYKKALHYLASITRYDILVVID